MSAAGRGKTTIRPTSSSGAKRSRSIATIRAAGAPSGPSKAASPGSPAGYLKPTGRQPGGGHGRRRAGAGRQPLQRHPRRGPGAAAEGRGGGSPRSARTTPAGARRRGSRSPRPRASSAGCRPSTRAISRDGLRRRVRKTPSHAEPASRRAAIRRASGRSQAADDRSRSLGRGVSGRVGADRVGAVGDGDRGADGLVVRRVAGADQLAVGRGADGGRAGPGPAAGQPHRPLRRHPAASGGRAGHARPDRPQQPALGQAAAERRRRREAAAAVRDRRPLRRRGPADGGGFARSRARRAMR